VALPGFRYDSDAYDDDLPYLVELAGRPHVVIPYSFDTNDMRFQAGGGFTLARDFASYVTDAFDWLWREGEAAPKLMSIGLHLWIIGRPGRIAALERILEHIGARGQAWIARRDAIARHWRVALPHGGHRSRSRTGSGGGRHRRAPRDSRAAARSSSSVGNLP
jgi:peptidoglycan/xylan/chitin deacetylase (PgdA/CDA1 family)